MEVEERRKWAKQMVGCSVMLTSLVNMYMNESINCLIHCGIIRAVVVRLLFIGKREEDRISTRRKGMI